jgi:hypothetical protein
VKWYDRLRERGRDSEEGEWVKWYDSLRERERKSLRGVRGEMGRGKEGERGRVNGQSET